METLNIQTLAELENIAGEVLVSCLEKETATVITLSGDLGAGKTAFVKALARLLKVPHEITSPTFVIMKSYEVSEHQQFTKLVHIDAYRIETDDEMRVLGFAELLADKSNLICIEWPEKIQNLIPKDAHRVTLALNADGTRTITF